ncbi:MAG TPA: GH25 family lysozyme [Bacteroidia bacterium]|jgi:GH25 family lysozyme M1 (1,4-beta-N-acetylmuramidase)|nr:GH25 family lysozyme [Bacteroidia bacterium]
MKKQLLLLSAFAIFSLSTSAQTILGVDVSSYQGTPNWTQVKADGITFAYAKATEGVTIKDADFVYNETNGKSAGLVMGAYHFAHPETNTATAEANYFLSVAKPYIKSCCLPPALDMEDPPSGPTLSSYFTPAQLTAWAETWMQIVYDSTGVKPVLYSDGSYAGSMYQSSITGYGGLWMADPDGNSSTPPATTGVWPTWIFKQWSFTATYTGISGQVDADVFNGSTTAFNTMTCSAVSVSFTSNLTAICPGTTVNFTDKSTSSGTITGWNWTFTGGTPSTSTSKNPSIKYSTSGVYNVKEVVTSTAGKDSVTYTAYIKVAPAGTLPVNEGFQEGFFPPTGWVLNFPVSTDSAWEHCTSLGNNSSECMYFPANCGSTSNITGERQQLYTPDYSFASAVKPKMWFDVAYEPSKVPTYSDTLVIYYSTDCGTTWTSLYSKGGMTLCTTGSTTGAGTDVNGNGCFVPPSSTAWRTDSVNISALAGKASVMFSFESRSGWGNIIYVDNINITGSITTSVQNLIDAKDVKVYPNPTKGSFNIELSSAQTEKAQVEIFDILGQQVYHALINSGVTSINLNAKPGMYLYRIMTETGDKLISQGKLIIQ